MTIQKAIEKAIEGDWRPEAFPLEEKSEDILVQVCTKEEMEKYDVDYPILFLNREYPEEGYYYAMLLEIIVIDPQFWQCLGKALGWKETSSLSFGSVIIEAECKMWVFYWHRMIDHIADGKDLTSFFETLE